MVLAVGSAGTQDAVTMSDEEGHLAHGGCQYAEFYSLLKVTFASNESAWQFLNKCDLSNSTLDNLNSTNFTQQSDQSQPVDYSNQFYAYVTPFVIFIGLLGNMISLRVFMSRGLRKLSASLYLAAISVSDSLVLIIYALLRWLNFGLPLWPGAYKVQIINHHVVCHAFLYFSYLFRFLSVWLIVIFTIERYIAACRPLQRRIICTKAFGRKAILFVTLTGSIMSVYKPIVSGVFDRTDTNPMANGASPEGSFLMLEENETSDRFCACNPKYTHVNFVMDIMYALSTTAIPFIIISVFNLLIVRTLIRRDATIKKLKIMFKDSRIRWEFTIMLLVMSSGFVCLNLPYFVVWCLKFIHNLIDSQHNTSVIDTSNANKYGPALTITRTIYTLNYSINFFLYCLTGAYYRGALVTIFTGKKARARASFRSASTTSCTRETKL